jgi:hypothetical protein
MACRRPGGDRSCCRVKQYRKACRVTRAGAGSSHSGVHRGSRMRLGLGGRACARGVGRGAVHAGQPHAHRAKRNHRESREQANRWSQGEPSAHRFALITVAGVLCVPRVCIPPRESLPRYPNLTPGHDPRRRRRICPADGENTQAGSPAALGWMVNKPRLWACEAGSGGERCPACPTDKDHESSHGG